MILPKEVSPKKRPDPLPRSMISCIAKPQPRVASMSRNLLKSLLKRSTKDKRKRLNTSKRLNKRKMTELRLALIRTSNRIRILVIQRVVAAIEKEKKKRSFNKTF